MNSNLKGFATFKIFTFIFEFRPSISIFPNQKTKKKHENWLKNKKVIQSQKIPEKCPNILKFLV